MREFLLGTIALGLVGLCAPPAPLAAATVAAAANAFQRSDARPNAPETCPYTGGDPELLAAAGIRSLGGFEFSRVDTHAVDELLGYADIRWVETDHIELGFALGSYQIKQDERAKIRAELEQLAAVWPEVNPKTRRLDPWLRAVLHARRLEAGYQRFMELAQVTDADFPDGTQTYITGTPYWGEGPHLGQRGKFEVLVVPSQAASVAFLRDQYGLTTEGSQRWNIADRDSLIIVTHTGQGQLTRDAALHGHLAFNLAINLFDGFRHYSYEAPVWLREGLGHFMEREIDPRYNTFDRAEGSAGVDTRNWKWQREAKELIAAGEAARTAQLLAKRSYAELEFADHVVCWSKTDYMIRVHPDGYACLLKALKGRKGADGYDDSSNLDDVHRDAFQTCFGLNHNQFDEAWAAWVRDTYDSNQ